MSSVSGFLPDSTLPSTRWYMAERSIYSKIFNKYAYHCNWYPNLDFFSARCSTYYNDKTNPTHNQISDHKLSLANKALVVLVPNLSRTTQTPMNKRSLQQLTIKCVCVCVCVYETFLIYADLKCRIFGRLCLFNNIQLLSSSSVRWHLH